MTTGEIEQEGVLLGELTPSKTGIGSIVGNLTSGGEIIGTLDVGFTARREENETYDGDYEVTSHPFESYELQTKDKLMVKNLTVSEIPYWETSNTSDGLTVYIGTEVNVNG